MYFYRNFCTKRAEPFHCNFENVSKLTKDAKQPAVMIHFTLENVKKHGFFKILSPPSMSVVSSFLRMKSGNSMSNIVQRSEETSSDQLLYVRGKFIQKKFIPKME